MRWYAALAVIPALAAAAPAPVQRDLMGAARAALRQGGFPVMDKAPVAVPMPDDEQAFRVPACGLFGSQCPSAPSETGAKSANGPLQTGFMALGSAGKTGTVDGPGRQGNGTYRVDQNDPYALRLWIATGYVEGTVSLTRDEATGRDVLGFTGKYWDQDKGNWGAPVSGSNEVVISYEARKDSGKIRWQENGSWKEERYWGGRAGRTSMTIELAGGWDHDFKQD
ncbi:MAG: hypothetical protein HY928_09945 [Elusimicrobia bacterium]|nr:hypothetical protein [Elusimicrobiota bacterium]